METQLKPRPDRELLKAPLREYGSMLFPALDNIEAVVQPRLTFFAADARHSAKARQLVVTWNLRGEHTAAGPDEANPRLLYGWRPPQSGKPTKVGFLVVSHALTRLDDDGSYVLEAEGSRWDSLLVLHQMGIRATGRPILAARRT